MAIDAIVPHPVVGLSQEEDTDDDPLILGPVIRDNKYCKIHTVVASSWQTESAEAHVFEFTSKAQARFLDRSVWPKLRKSLGFKQEVKKDDGRTIFIVSDVGPTLEKQTDTPSLKLNQLDIATTAKATSPVEPAVNTSSALHQLPTGFSSSGVGRQIFLRYCADCKGDELAPAFQTDGFPATTCPLSAEEAGYVTLMQLYRLEDLKFFEAIEHHKHLDQLNHLESMEWFKRKGHLPGHKTPTQKKSAKGTVLECWEESSEDAPERRRGRQIPKARHLLSILSLADEIAEESLNCGTDGVCQFGYRFMIEHLYPWQKQPLASKALAEQTHRQRAWTNHLGQVLQYLPRILKTQAAMAEKAWLASLSELHHIFGDKTPGGGKTEDQTAQNVIVMRWIIERSFSGFGPEAVAALANSFYCDGCDGEPIMRWMLRIRSHVRMRKWASEELSKAPDASDRANPVLMRLIEAHTAHELVLGMKPLLDRMHLVSHFELGYWEEMAAFWHGDDVKELEKISSRWKARRSILRPKRTE